MPNKNPAKTKSVPKFSAKSIRLVAIAVLLIALVAIALLTDNRSSGNKHVIVACGKYRADRVVSIDGTTFNAEVASNAAEFQKGLGGRPCILPDQAMMFAFTQPGQYFFWMKDMKFPIDIIWVSASDTIASYYSNVLPASYPNRYENDKNHLAQYVIEVKAGTVKKLGAGIGSPVGF